MADDCKRGLGESASKFNVSEALANVERAYEEFRGSTVEEFGGQEDFGFDIGGDDLSWI